MRKMITMMMAMMVMLSAGCGSAGIEETATDIKPVAAAIEPMTRECVATVYVGEMVTEEELESITVVETLNDGELWDIDRNDTLYDIDTFVVVFDTMGTDTIYDDEIIQIIIEPNK